MRSLDEWYKSINGMYLDRNFYRSLESVYLHFIEVTGPLCLAGQRGRKRHIDPETHLVKATAWFLATCGRAGIPSVEEMIWAKYPYACPYCREEVHSPKLCKEHRGPEQDPLRLDWAKLQAKGTENAGRRPRTLAEWQRMFNHIYPRSDNTPHELNIRRLAEEQAETAEAVRVIVVAPKFIVAEAPDLFAWLMGFANQFDFDRDEQPRADEFGQELERRMEQEYGAACPLCGHRVCKCPPIHPDTLGRIAKEGPVDEIFSTRKSLFSLQEAISHFDMALKGVQVSDKVYHPSDADYKQFRPYLEEIVERIKSLEDAHMRDAVSLATMLSRTGLLIQQGAALQEDVDALVEHVTSLPSPFRNTVAGFFTSLAASAAYGSMAAAVANRVQGLIGAG